MFQKRMNSSGKVPPNEGLSPSEGFPPHEDFLPMKDLLPMRDFLPMKDFWDLRQLKFPDASSSFWVTMSMKPGFSVVAAA